MMGRLLALATAALLTQPQPSAAPFGYFQGHEDVGAPLVLDPGGLARVDEATGDGDELAGEEMQVGFPVDTIHRQGAVAPHAAARMNGQRLA